MKQAVELEIVDGATWILANEGGRLIPAKLIGKIDTKQPTPAHIQLNPCETVLHSHWYCSTNVFREWPSHSAAAISPPNASLVPALLSPAKSQ